MTRFTQAASFAILCLAFWWRLLTWTEAQQSVHYLHVQLLPFYAIVTFGLVSAFIVLYRVATFNNCAEANDELMSQIKQAKQDLIAKGFHFPSNEHEQ